MVNHYRIKVIIRSLLQRLHMLVVHQRKLLIR
eukprot:UN03517